MLHLLSSVEDTIAPGRDPDLVLSPVVLTRPYLVLISRRKLDLALLQLNEYITCILLYSKLVKGPQFIELVLLDHVNHLCEVLIIDSIVEVSAPEQHLMLKQTDLLVVFGRELETLQDLSHVLVPSVHLALRSCQMGINDGYLGLTDLYATAYGSFVATHS